MYVTTSTGHTMCVTRYQSMLNYFMKLFVSMGALVSIEATKPTQNKDYSFIVYGIDNVPTDVQTLLAKAGVKTKVEKTTCEGLAIDLSY